MAAAVSEDRRDTAHITALKIRTARRLKVALCIAFEQMTCSCVSPSFGMAGAARAQEDTGDRLQQAGTLGSAETLLIPNTVFLRS